MMFDWFARLYDPFVNAPVKRPPDRMMAFARFFLAPSKGLLAAIIIVSLLSAVSEMALLVFLGIVVDWATVTPPEEFFSRYGWALAGMAFVILFVRPATTLLSRGLTSIAFVPGLTALAADAADMSGAAMARHEAAETAGMVTLESMRIHGGYGYTTEFPVERYYRDAAALIAQCS